MPDLVNATSKKGQLGSMKLLQQFKALATPNTITNWGYGTGLSYYVAVNSTNAGVIANLLGNAGLTSSATWTAYVFGLSGEIWATNRPTINNRNLTDTPFVKIAVTSNESMSSGSLGFP